MRLAERTTRTVVRYKDGRYVKSTGASTVELTRSLEEAVPFMTYKNAYKLFRERHDATDYTVVTVHIKMVAESDGHKLQYDPEVIIEHDSPEFKANKAKYLENQKKQKLDNEKLQRISWVIFLVSVPLTIFVYQVLSRWGIL